MMVFPRKHAGKWIASKGGKIVASGSKLTTLVKKVEHMKNRSEIRFDKVPPGNFAGACHGV